jgi:hypothetical protein
VIKVSNYVGKYDIIKSSWILDCIHAKERLELKYRYTTNSATTRIVVQLNLLCSFILCPTDSTKSELKKLYDKYGDSYTDNSDAAELKKVCCMFMPCLH